MKYPLKFGLIAAVLLLLIFSNESAYTAESRSVVYPGEVLTYEVSFLGIKLGKVIVETYEDEMYNGEIVHRSKVFMDSYDNIPYVSLHAVFESWIDKSLSFSHKFVANRKIEDDKWEYYLLNFNYDENNFHLQKWIKDEKIFEKNLEFDKKCNDGSSLFFLARQYTRLGRTARIPTMIDKTINYTVINFRNEQKIIEIDAVDYPINTIYFDGTAEWEGIYGMSGNFEGWFSNDDARIPIQAKVNVYVGSVKIELIEWKRGGWMPPRAEQALDK